MFYLNNPLINPVNGTTIICFEIPSVLSELLYPTDKSGICNMTADEALENVGYDSDWSFEVASKSKEFSNIVLERIIQYSKNRVFKEFRQAKLLLLPDDSKSNFLIDKTVFIGFANMFGGLKYFFDYNENKIYSCINTKEITAYMEKDNLIAYGDNVLVKSPWYDDIYAYLASQDIDIDDDENLLLNMNVKMQSATIKTNIVEIVNSGEGAGFKGGNFALVPNLYHQFNFGRIVKVDKGEALYFIIDKSIVQAVIPKEKLTK